MPTTTRGVPYSDGGDPPDGPSALHSLALYVDTNPGIATLTYAAINAITGAGLWPGRQVWQTNTGTNRPVIGLYEYNGVNWRKPWNSPWGVVAYAETTSLAQNIGTSSTDVIGLTTGSVAFVDNRFYEIRASIGKVAQNTASATVKVQITDLSNGPLLTVVNRDLAVGLGAGNLGHGERAKLLFGLSGTGGFKVRAVTSGDTMTATANSTDPGPAWIMLTDLGPDGSPT